MGTQQTTIRVLVVILALCGLWYAGWVFGHRILHDSEPILDPSAEAAYCIAVKLTSNEKKTLADSLSRPSDPVLIGRLMPIILSGAPSTEKSDASRAIEERDRLHHQTRQTISRIAPICGFDERRLVGRPETLLDLVVSWLRYDGAFNAMLSESFTRMPDALSRLDSDHARDIPFAALK
jgi:hypothetical protein